MNFTHKIEILVTMMVSICLLTSCDGSKPYKDLQDYVEKLKKTVVKDDTIIKGGAKKEAEPVSVKYASDTRRSPFEVLEATPTKGKDSLNPLQAYPLDMLRFVGTVTQDGNTIAFISAPDNKIYQIKAGDIIGDHDSEVIKVESDRVSLMEQYSNSESAAMKRVVTLQLKETSQ